MKRLRSLAAPLVAAVLTLSCMLVSAAPARSQFIYKFTGCDSYTTDDEWSYYGGPFLEVYRVTFDGSKLKDITLTPDYSTDGSQWTISPSFASVFARVQFTAPGQYLMIMSYTPFVYDTEYRNITSPETQSMFFVPYPVPISKGTIQVTDKDGRAVGAGVEIEFPGWSPELDPFDAVTDGEGQIKLDCVSRSRVTFPKPYDPLPSLLNVFVNDSTYGSFCNWVVLPESGSTVSVQLKPGGCTAELAQQPVLPSFPTVGTSP